MKLTQERISIPISCRTFVFFLGYCLSVPSFKKHFTRFRTVSSCSFSSQGVFFAPHIAQQPSVKPCRLSVSTCSPVLIFSLQLHLRRFMLCPQAVELFWADSSEVFLAFPDVNRRQGFTRALRKQNLPMLPISTRHGLLHPRKVSMSTSTVASTEWQFLLTWHSVVCT